MSLLYVRYIVRHKAINVKSFEGERKGQPRAKRVGCSLWLGFLHIFTPFRVRNIGFALFVFIMEI